MKKYLTEMQNKPFERLRANVNLLFSIGVLRIFTFVDYPNFYLQGLRRWVTRCYAASLPLATGGSSFGQHLSDSPLCKGGVGGICERLINSHLKILTAPEFKIISMIYGNHNLKPALDNRMNKPFFVWWRGGDGEKNLAPPLLRGGWEGFEPEGLTGLINKETQP